MRRQVNTSAKNKTRCPHSRTLSLRPLWSLLCKDLELCDLSLYLQRIIAYMSEQVYLECLRMGGKKQTTKPSRFLKIIKCCYYVFFKSILYTEKCTR